MALYNPKPHARTSAVEARQVGDDFFDAARWARQHGGVADVVGGGVAVGSHGEHASRSDYLVVDANGVVAIRKDTFEANWEPSDDG